MDASADCSAELLAACAAGDLIDVQRLLATGKHPAFSFRDSDGVSALMIAAGGGHGEIAGALLAAGAPWNAIDRRGKCAGNHALDAGHQAIVDQLVNAAVSAEMLLSAADRVERHHAAAAASASAASSADAESAEYLSRNVRYDGDRLLDEANDAVMMEWERPLMEVHAKRLCAAGGDMLNVGFGMGIIDGYIAALAPRSHTIMEAHPGVLERMEKDGWPRRRGVRILAGRWQDTVRACIAEGTKFDGIFFDTYGEHNGDMAEFHAALPQLLRPNGIYSFFNGMCPFNFFFQGVACSVVELELQTLGFVSTFEPMDISSPDKQWDGVRRRYFQADTYYLPHCVFVGKAAAAAAAAETAASTVADEVMEISDDGEGAASQLMALNAPVMHWLAQSVKPTADEATRALLREHILPHLEAAGWQLLVPFEAAWAESAGAAVSEARAAKLAAELDANSAAVLLALVRRAIASGAEQEDNDDELRLAILPNPLASPSEVPEEAMAAAGTAEGGEGGGSSAAGKDSTQHKYASADDVWSELAAGGVAGGTGGHGGEAGGKRQRLWYDVSQKYWDGVSADVQGMLGGLGSVHPADVAASLKLIDTLRASIEAPLPDGVALDCGAGIGRVSASVLLERFSAVELVEYSASFLQTAREQLPAARVHALHAAPLQSFVPPDGRKYAAVWVQWVLNYLTDVDLEGFLRRCGGALLPNGCVLVKESVSREGNGFYVDRSDASITRTDTHFRRIFSAAGLRVVHCEMQPGLPRIIFPVCMYVLRPAAEAVSVE